MNTLATYHAKNTGMLLTMVETFEADAETIEGFRVMQADEDANEMVEVRIFPVLVFGAEAYDKAAAYYFKLIRAN